MSALTLSNSYSPIFQDDTDRLMRILGMRREPLADYTKSLGYVREHNGGGGRHLLDFSKRGHHSLRRAYGASLGWILGDFSTSNASETIASNAGNALRAFFACDPNSGVIVLERHQDEFGVFLHEKTICGNPRMLLDEDCSLLLPTGVTSPRIGDEMLYERLDLARCYDRSAAFSVREVLFTGADGESIAGLGDVSGMFVENLPELLPSLYNILGDNYDLASINALIYSAIRRHSDYAPYESEIEVPLLESDDTDQNVTMLLRRTQRSSWRVVFLLGADTYTLEEVAPRRKLSVQESEVMAARSRLFSAFRSLPNFNGKIDLLVRPEGKDGPVYILDWKTNSLPSYGTESLGRAMTASDYHLQYQFYSQAVRYWLHGAELGGVAYMFVRAGEKSESLEGDAGVFVADAAAISQESCRAAIKNALK